MYRGAFDGGKRLMISALAAVALLAATTATASMASFDQGVRRVHSSGCHSYGV